MSKSNQLSAARLPLLAVVFICAVVFIAVIISTPPGGSDGVAVETTRGGRMIVIRAPATEGGQLQITVFDNNPYINPRGVTYEYNGQSKSTQLSLTEWDRINSIREEWCQQGVQDSIQEELEALAFDVGFRCQTSFGTMQSRRNTIPAQKLPVEIQSLIESSPLKP